jgi:hypothetical protein
LKLSPTASHHYLIWEAVAQADPFSECCGAAIEAISVDDVAAFEHKRIPVPVLPPPQPARVVGAGHESDEYVSRDEASVPPIPQRSYLNIFLPMLRAAWVTVSESILVPSSAILAFPFLREPMASSDP